MVHMKKGIVYALLVSMLTTIFMLQNPQRADAALDLQAESAILVEMSTGKVLYEKHADAMLEIASMSKMMSEYLILEAVSDGKIEWDQTVPISDHVRQLSLYTQLSNVPLRQDETYTVKDLYESVAIYSANASTIALAELIAGSETNFVKMMNEKAEELGLEDYHFVNSTGLNNSDLLGKHPEGTDVNDENRLTARATAKLAYHLLHDHPEVLDTASIPFKVFKEGTEDAIDMENWNWMLKGIRPQHDYDGIDGLKTGYTTNAGNAFTGTAERDGMRLITVVMRTSSRDARFDETKRLMNYGYNNFELREVLASGVKVSGSETLPVSIGKEKEVGISTNAPLITVVKKGEDKEFTPVLTLDETKLNENGELLAPVEAGEIVGSVRLKEEAEEDNSYLVAENKQQVDVVTDNQVEKAGWFKRVMRGIGGFFSSIWTSVADMVQGWFS